MKILIVLRKWEDKEGVGKTVKKIKEKLQKQGHIVETLSREDDLGITSLSNSTGPLREFILIKNKKEDYDIIYTHDWSIAFLAGRNCRWQAYGIEQLICGTICEEKPVYLIH